MWYGRLARLLEKRASRPYHIIKKIFLKLRVAFSKNMLMSYS